MQPYHSSKVKITINVAWFLFLRTPFILAVCAGSLCRKASLRCHACCSIVTLIILAVLNGSAPSAGGCTTRTRTCPTSRKSPTSEVSAWRRSSSVTATARHMCSTWRAKVKATRLCALSPLLAGNNKCVYVQMPLSTVLQISPMNMCKGRLSGCRSSLKRRMDSASGEKTVFWLEPRNICHTYGF